MYNKNAPDMNVLKQVRKALQEIAIAHKAGNIDKVLLQVYWLQRLANGKQPWSNYQPTIAEEFDE